MTVALAANCPCGAAAAAVRVVADVGEDARVLLSGSAKSGDPAASSFTVARDDATDCLTVSRTGGAGGAAVVLLKLCEDGAYLSPPLKGTAGDEIAALKAQVAALEAKLGNVERAVDNQGTIGSWSFSSADCGASNIADASGMSNNLAVGDGYCTPFGYVGGAWHLTGKASFDQLVVASLNNYGGGTAPFTVSMWVYRDKHLAYDGVMGVGSATQGAHVFVRSYGWTTGGHGCDDNKAGIWRLGVDAGTTDLWPCKAGGVTAPLSKANTWQHVAVVFAGSSTSLYVDGEVVITSSSTPAGIVGRLSLGSDMHRDNALHAIVDEPQMWNRALTAAEVLEVRARAMDAPHPHDAPGTAWREYGRIAYYTFDDCDTKDSSGSGNDLTARAGSGACTADGFVGKGWALNGQGVYPQLTRTGVLRWGGGIKAITIAAWVYIDAFVSSNSFSWTGSGIFGVGTTTTGNHMILRSNSWAHVHGPCSNSNVAGIWRLGIDDGSSDNWYCNDDASTARQSPLKTWTHLLLSWDTDEARLYVNGTKEFTAPINTPPSFADSLFLGGDAHADNVFKGTFDEVMVYARGVGDAEAAAMFAAGS